MTAVLPTVVPAALTATGHRAARAAAPPALPPGRILATAARALRAAAARLAHACALTLAALPAAAGPRFADETAALPAPHVYAGGWEHFVGGGVAVWDCNDDGRPDLFAAGGAAPSHLYLNATPGPGQPLAFAAGDDLGLTEVTGAYPLDLDGDGRLDLFVIRVGANRALKGLPGCRFEDITDRLALPRRDQWTTAFSATWEPGEERPTLAIGNYVDRFDPDGPFFACDKSWLLRPGPAGYVEQELAPSFCPLSMLISDWKRQGRPDLRVSNDRQYYVRGGYEQMFHLRPLREYGAAEGWRKQSLWGMGIASRDLTGDGLPEVMMTSMGDQLLQFNDGGTLRDAPYSVGVTAQRPFRGDDGRPSTGWHAEFADVDNDGRADLFIAKGNVEEMPSNAMHDPNNLLMQQPDGSFREAAAEAGVDDDARSRGAALVDFDGDGKLDLVVNNRRAPLRIYRNLTEPSGHWIEIRPEQPGGNAWAIGAWVELRGPGGPQAQEVTVGGGHASGHLTALHFGLGAGGAIEARVIWPDGQASDWRKLPMDRRIVFPHILPPGN